MLEGIRPSKHTTESIWYTPWQSLCICFCSAFECGSFEDQKQSDVTPFNMSCSTHRLFPRIGQRYVGRCNCKDRENFGNNKNNLRLFSISGTYSWIRAGYCSIRNEYCSAEAGYWKSEPSGRGVRAKRTTREWQADSKRADFSSGVLAFEEHFLLPN